MTGRDTSIGSMTLRSLRNVRWGVAVWVLSVGLGLSSVPVHDVLAAPSSDSQRYLSEAKSLNAKGDLPAAIIQLKNAVRADADNSEARYELALLYLRTNDPGGAQRELESARARGFDESKIVIPLMQAYILQGRFAEVVRSFDADKFQGDVRNNVLVAQARAHMAMGNNGDARTLIDKVLAESPNLASALSADAMLLRTSNKVKEAEAQIDKALSIEPDQPELLVLKGELRQQQQDVDGAMAAYNMAVEKAPRFTRGRIARAMLNLATGKFEAVNADLQPVLAAEPQNPLGLYLRAFLLARDSKFQESTELLLNLPQVVEGYPPARYLLAASAFANNQIEIAYQNAEQYVARVPQDVNGVKLLAAIAHKTGNSTRAVQLLEPLANQLPNDNQFKLQLADAYLGVGRSEEAIKLFQQGVAADPNNQNARLALAVSQIRSGATDKGVEELEKLIAGNPGSNQATGILILTLLQKGDNKKALEAANSLITAQPDSANAYNLQGTVHLSASNIDAARKSFTTALEKDPKFIAAALNLGRVEERANQIPAAEAWYNKALAIDSKNVTAFEGLASLAMSQRNYDAAISHLDRAIQLNPKATQPRLRMIGIFLDQKENNRALIAARAFINELPNDPSAIDALGRTQLATGDLVNAVGTYQRLASQFPDNAEAQRRLGRAYAAADKKQDAKATFDRVIALAPDFNAGLIDRLNLEREMNGMDAALAMAKKLADERPDSVPRLAVYGDMQATAQRNEDALATYTKVWQRSPDVGALQRMYFALNRLDRGEESVKMLRNWVAKNPNDYSVRFMIASHLISTGKFDEALAETEAMNGVLPDNPVLLNNIAWLYGMKGNPKAVDVAERAYRLAPQSPDIADTLGWLYHNNGDNVRSLELLAKAFEMAPKRPEIAYHYAAALKRAGDSARARDVLSKALEVKEATFAERPKAEALYKELGG